MSLSYDDIAESYDELYGEEQRAKYRVVLRLVEPREPVLDAGCGTGMLLEHLQCYYVGLDLSYRMLEVARKKGRGVKGDLVCGDAERMPFRDGCFRSVYSVTVVHEAPGLVHELLRVLAPGGSAAVTLLKKRHEALSWLVEQAPVTQVVEEELLKDLVLVLARAAESPSYREGLASVSPRRAYAGLRKELEGGPGSRE
uniref:Class I SAM-dependent methyltransferase n=1 Tax=Thermofilum pendens TaxID=2269 RepID=A0A7C4B9R6_THEPE